MSATTFIDSAECASILLRDLYRLAFDSMHERRLFYQANPHRSLHRRVWHSIQDVSSETFHKKDDVSMSLLHSLEFSLNRNLSTHGFRGEIADVFLEIFTLFYGLPRHYSYSDMIAYYERRYTSIIDMLSSVKRVCVDLRILESVSHRVESKECRMKDALFHCLIHDPQIMSDYVMSITRRIVAFGGIDDIPALMACNVNGLVSLVDRRGYPSACAEVYFDMFKHHWSKDVPRGTLIAKRVDTDFLPRGRLRGIQISETLYAAYFDFQCTHMTVEQYVGKIAPRGTREVSVLKSRFGYIIPISSNGVLHIVFVTIEGRGYNRRFTFLRDLILLPNCFVSCVHIDPVYLKGPIDDIASFFMGTSIKPVLPEVPGFPRDLNHIVWSYMGRDVLPYLESSETYEYNNTPYRHAAASLKTYPHLYRWLPILPVVCKMPTDVEFRINFDSTRVYFIGCDACVQN